jgi:hypothetical protein
VIKQRPAAQVPAQSASQADPSSVPASTTMPAPQPDAPSVASGGSSRWPKPPGPGKALPGLEASTGSTLVASIPAPASLTVAAWVFPAHPADTGSSVPIATTATR